MPGAGSGVFPGIQCTCGSGVEDNRMGMEQRIKKNTLSAMQNLSSFLLSPVLPSSLIFLYLHICVKFQPLEAPRR